MIIVAGGSSNRFGADKLTVEISGRPLLELTVSRVREAVHEVIVVCRPEVAATLNLADVVVVPGGTTRTGSEIAGIQALSAEAELVGIHDGARPLVTRPLIDALYSASAEHGGAVPVVSPSHPLVDRATLEPVSGAAMVQTPQVFRVDVLRSAYAKAAQEGFTGHDTAHVVAMYEEVAISAVPGDPDNVKVTYPGDIEVVKAKLRGLSGSEPE